GQRLLAMLPLAAFEFKAGDACESEREIQFRGEELKPQTIGFGGEVHILTRIAQSVRHCLDGRAVPHRLAFERHHWHPNCIHPCGGPNNDASLVASVLSHCDYSGTAGLWRN